MSFCIEMFIIPAVITAAHSKKVSHTHLSYTSNESRIMKKIIKIIAEALVDQPELVFVTEIGGAHTSILELMVAKADIGKVIGKQGRTAGAIRTILSAVSAKEKKRAVLEIVE
jgi:predicted RNA-binding protein YlqC (UPF0109 family)